MIVNARAAAVGDALARILRSQGDAVESQYYVNDAGNQFPALARSVDVRLRQALGEAAELPEGAYPGEYLVDLVREWLAREPGAMRAIARLPETERARAARGHGGARHGGGQRRVLEAYGTRFDRWVHERRDVRDAGLPARAIDGADRARATPTSRTARSGSARRAFGDDKDRVLRKSDGELTYFGVDIGFHASEKLGAAPSTSSTSSARITTATCRASRRRCRRSAIPPERFDVLIVQLVTLLRDGQPVRMSKRRGEFVLMEELLEEVGRDAARFTFLTRRHDSPLEFDLAVATRQSADNPVFYVQYAHARVASLLQERGGA